MLKSLRHWFRVQYLKLRYRGAILVNVGGEVYAMKSYDPATGAMWLHENIKFTCGKGAAF